MSLRRRTTAPGRRAHLAGLLAAVLMLLAACGQGASESTRPTSLTPSPTGIVTNRQAAQAEADRLLALALVPPGAVATTVDPAPGSPLAGPLLGRPGVTSLVDRTRMWTVQQSFDQTMTWLRDHPPVGLSASESGTSGTDIRGAGIGYSDTGTTQWSDGELQIGVGASTATESQIRVDAQVIWLSSSPYPDARAGSRLKVTVAKGCPSSNKGMVGVTNSGAGLSAAMVPPGTPTAGLICRYNGPNDQAFALDRSTKLGRTMAGRIALALQRIQLSHPLGEVVHCPMDDGSVSVIALTYAGRPDVDLWYERTGCTSVANGRISAGAGGFGAVVGQ